MDFSHVTAWIFDLDNTLYPPEAQLFAQIEVRMTAWMMRALDVPQDHANRLRADYWRLHGTTLAGLMAEHQVDPAAYLADVHDIDFSVLTPDPDLAAAIAALPGRRIIHTNGDAGYARRVLAARALPEDLFDAVYGIEEAGFHPKPDPRAYQGVCDRHGIAPASAFFVDDMAHNLKPAHALGMVTGWVNNGSERGDHGHSPDFIDYEIADLTDWLEELTA